jgi:hypothetical protein
MGEDAGHSSAASGIPARRRKANQASLYKKTRAFAIDVDEGKNLAIAGMSPAERARITPLRPKFLSILLAFEMDSGQLGGNPLACFGQRVPVAIEPRGQHDVPIHFGYPLQPRLVGPARMPCTRLPAEEIGGLRPANEGRA